MSGAVTKYTTALNLFAWFLVACVLILICIGGLVTSHGAGLSVPDWPNSYGYNMFTFPLSMWLWNGGIFYEHSHRLMASFVGMLTIGLASALACLETRRWLRKLGWISLALVIFQGVLGGLRVTLLKDQIGVFHAILAQLFFLVVLGIALATSRFWNRMGDRVERLVPTQMGRAKQIFLGITVLVGLQLVIAATMRHQHAGLAIPDFPKAYGQWWPDTDPASVLAYNQARIEERAFNSITRSQIYLQMAHRFVAYVLALLIAWVALRGPRTFGGSHPLTKLGYGWFGLVCLQIGLGAWTIWSNKAADIATLHVAVGALILAVGFCLTVLSFRWAHLSAQVCKLQQEEPVEGQGERAASETDGVGGTIRHPHYANLR